MRKIYLSLFAICSITALKAQTTTRLPLIEGLSSATCGPCASWNGMYTPIINSNAANDQFNPGVAVVKYQMDWPSPDNDPSYNPDANMRKAFYATSGIPDWYIDGEQNDGSQSQIDNHQADPAPLKITAAYTLTGNTIDVTVQIIPLSNLGSGNRCYIAIANKQYTYTGGTNGETQFHHVVRKMLPDGAGTFLPSLVANDTITITESYTYTVASGIPAQGSYDFWNNTFEIVCWVQKTTTRTVQNAAVAPEGALGIEEGERDDFGMIVFPNPTNSSSEIIFDASEKSETIISVFNELGELVLEEYKGNLSGRQRFSLSTENLSDGIYFVKVVNGDQMATKPLMIQR